ncbi:MAG: hypothetical protein RLP12_06060, partial [Ekhidna sp.]
MEKQSKIMIAIRNKNAFVLFWLILLVFGLNAQDQESMLIRRESKFDFNINGVSVGSLIFPGDGFESLKVFGEPLDSDYKETPADEWWTFVYDGITLIYTNYSGEIELSEIIIDGTEINVSISGNEVRVSQSINPLLKSISARSEDNIQIEKATPELTLTKKYGKAFSFIQIDLRTDKESVE